MSRLCGFIGVDVFFVISGYLITSLLAAEYAKHGSISIPRFYLRCAAHAQPVRERYGPELPAS